MKAWLTSARQELLHQHDQARPQQLSRIRLLLPPRPRPVGRVTTAESGTFTLDATSAASPYLGVSPERYQTAWASVLEVNSPQVARDLKWFKGYGSRRVCQ